MVLAIGSFRVSKYAQSAMQGGGGDLGFGLGTMGGAGGIPGVPDAGGNFNLVPGNTFPQTLLPGGESIPGVGGSPFLPGGVPMTPAFSETPFGPVWDLNQGGFDQGIHEFHPTGQKLFGPRIINVNLPKMISAGQAFVIIVTYKHEERTREFGTYKIKLSLPSLSIVETTDEKRIGAGAQDSVSISLTAPAPLPNAPVTGTVELIATEGNDVTVDSEVITIPTEVVPNPPIPNPPPDQVPPVPPPTPPSEPPVMPPPPPVPLPPVLQQVNVNVTRGEDGGFQAIIIEASGLEGSEPCTVFVYLSQKEYRGRGRHRGWGRGRGRDDDDNDNDNDYWKKWLENRGRDVAVSQTTPAGSVAANSNSNWARAYPATVSVQGITANGNGLNLNNRMPTVASIQSQVRSRISASDIQARVQQSLARRGIQNTSIRSSVANAVQQTLSQIPNSPIAVPIAAANAARSVVAMAGGNSQTIAIAGNAAASASAGGGAAAASAGNVVAQAIANAGMNQAVAVAAGQAAAAAGEAVAVSIAVGEPHGVPPLPTPPIFQPGKPIYKRQRVSITASPDGTIRHVVRIKEAGPQTPLFGYVIVYGHRSRKHTGRRKFQL